MHLVVLLAVCIALSYSCVTVPAVSDAEGSCCRTFLRPNGMLGSGCVDTTFEDCGPDGNFVRGQSCSDGVTCGACCEGQECSTTTSNLCSCNFLPGYACTPGNTLESTQTCPTLTGSCCSDGVCTANTALENCDGAFSTFTPSTSDCGNSCGGSCCEANGDVVSEAYSKCTCSMMLSQSDPGLYCNPGYDCSQSSEDGINCVQVAPQNLDVQKRSISEEKKRNTGDTVEPCVFSNDNYYCISVVSTPSSVDDTCACGIGISDENVVVNSATIFQSAIDGDEPDFSSPIPYIFSTNENTAMGFENAARPLGLDNWFGFAGQFMGSGTDLDAISDAWMCFEYSSVGRDPVDIDTAIIESAAGVALPNGAPIFSGPSPARFFSSLQIAEREGIALLGLSLFDGTSEFELNDGSVFELEMFLNGTLQAMAEVNVTNNTIATVEYFVTLPNGVNLILSSNNVEPFLSDAFPIMPGLYNLETRITSTSLRTLAANIMFTIQQQQTVSGDPHFRGLKGQKYDFHGVPDKIFNLISDEALTVNALFVDADLREQKNKTYIGALGFRICNGDDPEIKVEFKCNRDVEGTKSVLLNGKQMEVGKFHDLGTVTVIQTGLQNGKTRISTKFGYKFSMRFSSSRHSTCHINFKAAYQAGEDSPLPHGVLGQTAGLPANLVGDNMNSPNVVEGKVSDYIIQENDLFGTKFTFNKFYKDKCPSPFSPDEFWSVGYAE